MLISMLTKRKRTISRTKSGKRQSGAMGASRMLSTMAALRAVSSGGNGANTRARIRTSPTSTSVSQKPEIRTVDGLTSKETTLKELKLVAATWLKTFIAAGLATYLAVGLDIEAILNAALAATIPSIINYLNPKYDRYGRK